MCKKDYIWNPAKWGCKNGKYLANIIKDSVIRCDEIIEETKTIPTKHLPGKGTSANFSIWLAFLLTAIAFIDSY